MCVKRTQGGLKTIENAFSRLRGCRIWWMWAVPERQKSCSRPSEVYFCLLGIFLRSAFFFHPFLSLRSRKLTRDSPKMTLEVRKIHSRWLQGGPKRLPRRLSNPKVFGVIRTWFRSRVISWCSWKLPRASLRLRVCREAILA